MHGSGAGSPHAEAGRFRERRAGGAAGPVANDRILTTRVGLRIPERIDFETWARAGGQLARISDSSTWCLGDWLVHGQDRYTEGYRKVVEEVGLDYQTLRNYAWVARRFPWARRRPELSFQHHAEVTPLDDAEQDRWLDDAQRHGWSRNELRRRLRASRRTGRAESHEVALPRLAVPAEQFERWRTAAEQSRSGFTDWVVAALDEAAARRVQPA
ncbi:hypothetical protein SUDANB95_04821 [Actinosynnema sp. ALI-1.44]